jgi:hypothetical protein
MSPSKRNTRLSVSRRPLPTFRSTSSVTVTIHVQYSNVHNVSIALLSGLNVLLLYTWKIDILYIRSYKTKIFFYNTILKSKGFVTA